MENAASRNKGMRKAKELAFLDPDDKWYPNKLHDVYQIVNVRLAMMSFLQMRLK